MSTNSTVRTLDGPGSYDPGFGIDYGMGLGAVVLLIITIFIICGCFCGHRFRTSSQQQEQSEEPSDRTNRLVVVGGGLDEATLLSYPTLTYVLARLERPSGSTITNCCSICLADYADSDMLRLLPDCGHVFHLKCVDPWLKLHASCPICRSAPLPSPLPAPSV